MFATGSPGNVRSTQVSKCILSVFNSATYSLTATAFSLCGGICVSQVLSTNVKIIFPLLPALVNPSREERMILRN